MPAEVEDYTGSGFVGVTMKLVATRDKSWYLPGYYSVATKRSYPDKALDAV